MKLRVASRESRLAVIQSQQVMETLARLHPELELELVTMKTTGDRILDRTLDQIGGKGLFVRELDETLRSGRAELSVHSCKDLPMEEPADLPLLAFSCREDPRDALVLPRGVQTLDLTRPVGCASLRRTLQFQVLYPDARVEPVRGNVLTRLRKLDEGQFSALILAVAGLRRLGLEERISRIFTPEEMLPAAGQGILAVQGRMDLDPACLAGLDDPDGRDCTLAERAFVRTLDGGCSAPTAAYAQVEGDTLTIRGLYADTDGRLCRGSASGPRQDGAALAVDLARRLKEDAHVR